MNNTPYMVFAGTKSRYLAEEICKELGCKLGQMNTTYFADGEFAVSYEESIRGKNVFLVQSTFPNSDNLMELLLMVDAAKRASAKSIVAVMPYFGWARQDRKDKPRVSIGAKLVADLLSVAGVNRIITMDLHAAQIQGFFDIPLDHLVGMPILARMFETREIDDLVVVSPDLGSVTRARNFAARIDAPLAIIDKRRDKHNEAIAAHVIGDVKDKVCVMFDDMIDTAGTICMAADMLMEKGAKSVRAVITHPVLSGAAYERINASQLQEVIVTDTIPLNQEKDLSKFTVLSVADIFAEVIEHVHNYKEISSLFYK